MADDKRNAERIVAEREAPATILSVDEDHGCQLTTGGRGRENEPMTPDERTGSEAPEPGCGGSAPADYGSHPSGEAGWQPGCDQARIAGHPMNDTDGGAFDRDVRGEEPGRSDPCEGVPHHSHSTLWRSRIQRLLFRRLPGLLTMVALAVPAAFFLFMGTVQWDVQATIDRGKKAADDQNLELAKDCMDTAIWKAGALGESEQARLFRQIDGVFDQNNLPDHLFMMKLAEQYMNHEREEVRRQARTTWQQAAAAAVPLCFEAGKVDLAERICREMIQLGNQIPYVTKIDWSDQVYGGLANVEIHRGDIGAADKYDRELINQARKDGKEVLALLRIGERYNKAGRDNPDRRSMADSRAEQYFRQAVSLEESLFSAPRPATQDATAGSASNNTILKMSPWRTRPYDFSVHTTLANFLIKRHRLEEAGKVLDRCQQLVRAHLSGYDLRTTLGDLASIYERMGDKDTYERLNSESRQP